jgi:hemophore-related protein
MVKHTPARLVVVVCALALAWTTGAGVASAQPDVGPFLNTTCTYSQAEAALNALAPDGGKEFAASPMTQTWMHAFLDSPVDQRRQLIQQQAPALQPYTALLAAMANTCNSYPAA